MAEPAYRPVPLAFERLALDEPRARLGAFRRQMLTRRTVRHYSSDPVPDALIDEAIAIAGVPRRRALTFSRGVSSSFATLT